MVAVLIGTAGLTALVIFNFLWNAIGLSLHLIQRPHGTAKVEGIHRDGAPRS